MAILRNGAGGLVERSIGWRRSKRTRAGGAGLAEAVLMALAGISPLMVYRVTRG
jgi:hypothetical protein